MSDTPHSVTPRHTAPIGSHPVIMGAMLHQQKSGPGRAANLYCLCCRNVTDPAFWVRVSSMRPLHFPNISNQANSQWRLYY